MFAEDEEGPVPEIEGVGDFSDENDGREAEEFAGSGEGVTVGEDQESGTQHRREGGEAGEGSAHGVLAEGKDDESEAGPAEEVEDHPACGKSDGNDGDDGAEEEFPSAGGEEVKSGGGMAEDAIDAPNEGEGKEEDGSENHFGGTSFG